MASMRVIAVAFLLLLSTDAFYIYEPSNQPVEQISAPTVGDLILEGFKFNGPNSAQNPLVTSPKFAIKKRATIRRSVPHEASINLLDQPEPGTRVKRAENYPIATGSTPSQTQSAAIDEDLLDFSYFSAVQFGSSGAMLYMLLDTGSSDTWVMGSDCKSTACGTHTTFGQENSATLKTSETSFSETYGTGNVSGMVVSDTVEFAGMKVPLTFGSGSEVSDHFDNYPMDGILALGRPGPCNLGGPTFLQALGNAKLLPANIFGINLQRHADGTTDGEVNFGTVDTSKFEGELTYVDTANDQLWEIPIDDVLVDGVACKITGNTAIIDTGTSQLFMPPAQAKQFFAQISGSVQMDSETFHIPCATTISIQMVFAKVPFSISPEDYVGSPVTGGNLCASTIFGVQVEGPTQFLLGDVFLKNVYSVFDSDKSRIGFGTSQAASTGSSSSGATVSTSSASTIVSVGPQSSNVSPSSLSPASSGTSTELPDSPALPAAKSSASAISLPSGSSTQTGVSGSTSAGTAHGSATGTPGSSIVVLGAAGTATIPTLWGLLLMIPCIVTI
ncbi:hypothetical protein MMC26_002717 [Xylographa opegraphella]|nr:hypothetical protein [Xylographa opegraphella]